MKCVILEMLKTYFCANFQLNLKKSKNLLLIIFCCFTNYVICRYATHFYQKGHNLFGRPWR